MDLAAVERSFGELLAAFGDMIAAATRGAADPARAGDPAGVSNRAFVRRYRARRRAIGDALADFDHVPAGEDARALANMRAVLGWLDQEAPTPGARVVGGAGTKPDPEVARLRSSPYRRYGAAAAAIRVGRETIDRLTLLNRLATEPDPLARRALFEAQAPLWRVFDGDGGERAPYRELIRASAAAWAAGGSPVEANAVALGIAPGTIETTLREVLGAWRAVVGPGRVEPWDHRYGIGAASRRLDRWVPLARLTTINREYLTSLGADPVDLGIEYDIVPRPGRPPVPVAFTLGMGADAADTTTPGAAASLIASDPVRPRPPLVFATYQKGSLGNLGELLHESGHALHYASVRARPAFLEWDPDTTAFLEGTADLLGWDADEPAWQRRWLGASAEPRSAILGRYGNVMLDICWALFEIELHHHPERRPNDVWTELAADGLGVEPHPELAWWAVRGQLVDSPGYMANYALSALIAAAVRARILEVLGPWWEGDPGWYRFVADGLFVAGASRSPAELLEAFLGGPLTAGPLLADIRRAG